MKTFKQLREESTALEPVKMMVIFGDGERKSYDVPKDTSFKDYVEKKIVPVEKGREVVHYGVEKPNSTKTTVTSVKEGSESNDPRGNKYHVTVEPPDEESVNEAADSDGYHTMNSWSDGGLKYKYMTKDHMHDKPANRHQSSITMYQLHGKVPVFHARHHIEQGFWTNQTSHESPTTVTHKSEHSSLESAKNALKKHTDKFYSVKESVNEDEDKEFANWKDAVKKQHTTKADKIKFISRPDAPHISAEVPGEDRSYGVWNHKKGRGEVLGEEYSEKNYEYKNKANKLANLASITYSNGDVEHITTTKGGRSMRHSTKDKAHASLRVRGFKPTSDVNEAIQNPIEIAKAASSKAGKSSSRQNHNLASQAHTSAAKYCEQTGDETKAEYHRQIAGIHTNNSLG